VTRAAAPLSLPAALTAEVRRAARARGWDADAYLAHLVRIGMRAMEAMRVNVAKRSR
jgi:hypothetical protein